MSTTMTTLSDETGATSMTAITAARYAWDTTCVGNLEDARSAARKLATLAEKREETEAVRDDAIWRARIEGHSFRKIGEAAGLSEGRIRAICEVYDARSS